MARLLFACVVIFVTFACWADEAANAKKGNDVLATAINASLAQRPTVVYWVFDESESMVTKRKEIAKRLGRVFFLVNNPGLRNIVVSFGQNVAFVTKSPTINPAAVTNALEQIPVDDSGIEMTFGAIQKSIEHSKTVRQSGENMIIVVFTDEAGNDGDLAECTSISCQKAKIPVYVVGVPAPFGLKQVMITRDQAFQLHFAWGVVNRGPESRFLEVVHLANDIQIDSGFGPFHLSEICTNTGGEYFRANTADGGIADDENARKEFGLHQFFTPEAMKNYRPNYASREIMEHEIASNRAKKALVEAAVKPEKMPVGALPMIFPMQDDRALVGLIGEAQNAAARAQPKIDSMHEILRAGLSDREKVEEKRWQASYDLSLGRLLASKVRVDGYNLMLAQAKSGMKFKQKDSNAWELVPSETLSAGLHIEMIAKQAKSLLEKVVKEHPGTPWAYYASEELKTPLGYKWIEKHTGDKKEMLVPTKPKKNLKNI